MAILVINKFFNLAIWIILGIAAFAFGLLIRNLVRQAQTKRELNTKIGAETHSLSNESIAQYINKLEAEEFRRLLFLIFKKQGYQPLTHTKEGWISFRKNNRDIYVRIFSDRQEEASLADVSRAYKEVAVVLSEKARLIFISHTGFQPAARDFLASKAIEGWDLDKIVEMVKLIS